MTNRRLLPLPLVVAAFLFATPAMGAVRLGLGADYWFNSGGIFKIDLAADAHLVRHISIGGRFGAALIAYQGGYNTVGVPIDFDIRGHFGLFYVEGLVGPWLVFDPNAFLVRAHGAFGFGIANGQLQFGLEVGYLQPAPQIGLRVAWRL